MSSRLFPAFSALRLLPLLTGLLLAGALPQMALADPPNQAGRISALSGGVSFHAIGDDTWSAAELNYPLTSGDAIATSTSSQAEVESGPLKLRLDESSQLDISSLGLEEAAFTLSQGKISLQRLASPFSLTARVKTAGGEVIPEQEGAYQIAAPTTTTPLEVTVWSGALRVEAEGGSLNILPGQTAVILGGAPLSYSIEPARSLLRGQRAPAALPSYRPPHNLPLDLTGLADLDSAGRWRETPDLGWVWTPSGVSSSWQPYRYGHWANVPPWGWTWIDNASWGFTPFHYGRWVALKGRWVWVPGRSTERPLYAPALVAFLGGSGWRAEISAGTPPVGWLPLAPGEPYFPPYEATPRYLQRLNGLPSHELPRYLEEREHSGRAEPLRNRDHSIFMPPEDFQAGHAPHQHELPAPAEIHPLVEHRLFPRPEPAPLRAAPVPSQPVNAAPVRAAPVPASPVVSQPFTPYHRTPGDEIPRATPQAFPQMAPSRETPAEALPPRQVINLQHRRFIQPEAAPQQVEPAAPRQEMPVMHQIPAFVPPAAAPDPRHETPMRHENPAPRETAPVMREAPVRSASPEIPAAQPRHDPAPAVSDAKPAPVIRSMGRLKPAPQDDKDDKDKK